jgi:hypothetical protein
VRTFADHSRTIDALHALAAEYPLLPAPDIQLVPHLPGELLLSLWDLSAFEAWREALHADDDSVEYGVTAVGQVRLVAQTRFDGVSILIHGYSPQARRPKVEAA